MRLIILLLLTSNFVFAQYWGGQEIDASDLTDWIPKNKTDYTGDYHFGESEGESDFHLFFAEDVIIGQIINAYWDENSVIKNNYTNLTNITIDSLGTFTSDQHTGKFIRYKTAAGNYIEGLKIDNPWSDWVNDSEFEIGNKRDLDFEYICYGNYRTTSRSKLNSNDLAQMSPQELKIMRNEIFARYGYRFKKGGEMDTYFRKQDWYNAQHNQVAHFLTEIEQYNINLIKKHE